MSALAMFRRTANRGFTLAELMVASSILVILLGAYLGAFQNILKNASYSEGLSLAYTACRSKLEEMVDYDFSRIPRDYAGGGSPGNTFVPAGFPASFNVMGNVTVTDQGTGFVGGEQIMANNLWPARYGHTSLVYDNRMWVIGGRAGGNYFNDVWSSPDGINWTEALTDEPPNINHWSRRYGHTSVVYKNKMWVMGGKDSSGNYLNDVWYSNDGQAWIQVTTNPPMWPARYGHVSVVYNDRMWVMAGFNGSYPNDVWSSTDGINWTEVLPDEPPDTNHWPGRNSPFAIVYNNQMWIMGGSGNRNDVWSSTDGINWTEVLPDEPPDTNHWPGREGHTALVYDNKMLVMGGIGSSGTLSDMWYSDDGIDWILAAYSGMLLRSGHTSLVYNNTIFTIGGRDSSGNLLSDVWANGGYNRLLEIVITVCWRHPDGRMFGEDANLDGTWNPATEDANGNGLFDSPAQLRVMLSEKNMLNLRKIFLGRP